MTKKPELKLSELSDDVDVSAEYSNVTYTVAELKREIIVLREPHHETGSWHAIERQKWNPDAKYMVECYIENEASELYEDAGESMMDHINADHIARIQAILEESFPNGLDYWIYGKDVEIDIFPPDGGKSE